MMLEVPLHMESMNLAAIGEEVLLEHLHDIRRGPPPGAEWICRSSELRKPSPQKILCVLTAKGRTFISDLYA